MRGLYYNKSVRRQIINSLLVQFEIHRIDICSDCRIFSRFRLSNHRVRVFSNKIARIGRVSLR